MGWDLFDGAFDLNGDGETDLIEQAIGLSILEELSKEGEEADE